MTYKFIFLFLYFISFLSFGYVYIFIERYGALKVILFVLIIILGIVREILKVNIWCTLFGHKPISKSSSCNCWNYGLTWYKNDCDCDYTSYSVCERCGMFL